MHLIIQNLSKPEGRLYVAVYDKEADFLKPDQIHAQRITAVNESGSIELFLSELPPGTYAVSCFHDVNGNGKLDTNLLGIPTEPYGFSNNARPKFRAPKWDEAKVEWRKDGAPVMIRLEKW